MNRATSLALHRATCRDEDCGFCQNRAEERAADMDPEYDVQAAENSYERAMGW